MKKTLLLILFLLAALLLPGCGGSGEEVGDPVEAYLTVIAALEEPEAFCAETGMNYIALDTRNMSGIADRKSKERLFGELESAYSTAEILDKNEVQLARGGYLEDNRFEDGVLFKLKEADYATYDKSPVSIEVQEWGRGAETMLNKKFVLEAGENGWTITEVTDVTVKKIN